MFIEFSSEQKIVGGKKNRKCYLTNTYVKTSARMLISCTWDMLLFINAEENH